MDPQIPDVRRSDRLVPLTAAISLPFASVLLAGTALTGYLIWPFMAPLFLSACMAVALAPLHARLTRLCRGHRQIAGVLMTLGLFAFIIAPLASSIAVGIREVTTGLQWVNDSLGIVSLKDLSTAKLPPQMEETLSGVLGFLNIGSDNLHEIASHALEWVQSVAPTALSMSVNAAGNILFVLAAYYFFTVDGKRMVDYLCRISPLQGRQTEELIEEFRQVSSAALLGSVVTSLVIGALVAIGFLVVGIPHAIFFGIATTIAGFIPVIGSAVVWLPAAAILAFNGRIGAAIGLGIWCTVGVLVADNVLKPLLMRGKNEIHMGLLFLSLLGGLAMFGGIGIIAGPVIMAFFLALLRIYARDYAKFNDGPTLLA